MDSYLRDRTLEAVADVHCHLVGPIPLEHQNAHPADVPETLASLERVARELGWAPRIFFPGVPVVAETGSLERKRGS